MVLLQHGRITRQASPVKIINQKQLENVQCFKCWGCLITNDVRCEIKSQTAMAKAAFSKKTVHRQTGLKI
jgi:hypothetical protein